MTRALHDALDRLVSEPLRHVSLGSKELIHSNLLGWMCERFPAAARDVLEPWLTVDPAAVTTRIRREYKHLDLVIEYAGYAPLVIENKVFALPDGEQLRRYGRPLKAMVRPTAVLLSVPDPGWPEGRFWVDRQEWRYVPYKDLAPRLRETFTGRAGFDAAILRHESVLIEALNALIDLVGHPGAVTQ